MSEPVHLAEVNPDHHLWRNGRFWWIAFTLIHEGWRQERVRRSLKTADVAVARQRRDAILHEYAAREGAALSLRFVASPVVALRAA